MRQQRALESITARIVECCDPDAVLLFGSYAKGQENRESDFDLLVIGAFRESPHLRGREIRDLLRRYPVRIDLHLATPEEVAAASSEPWGFLSSALSSGVRLYEKTKHLS